MGFFKKIFKGIKKHFKKVGRRLKKIAMKVGKFMNKIGWVGQLALQFILPGIGTMLSVGLKGLGALGGVLGAVAKPLAWVMNQAGKFAKVGSNIFRTVTSGIKSFVGNMGKAILSKIPGGSKLLGAMKMESIGFKEAWGKVQTEIGNNFKGILDPFKVAKGKSILGKGRTLESISKSTGLSIEEIGKYNPDMVSGVDPGKWGSVIAGQESRVHTQFFDITMPETVGIDFTTGELTLPDATKAGEITIPKTTGIDVTTEGPLYSRDRPFTFPEAGEVTLGDLKPSEVKIPYTDADPIWNPKTQTYEKIPDYSKMTERGEDWGVLKDPYPDTGPSLLDPYGKMVARAGQAALSEQPEQEGKGTGAAGPVFEKPEDIAAAEKERLSATDIDFGSLAGQVAANVRANYDRLMREGGMFGYSQTVYDEWSRSKPRLSAIG